MKKLIKQGIQFLCTSGIGWIIDFGIFSFLTRNMGNVSLVNMISSLVAVTFVFSVSTKKTFSQRSQGLSLGVKYVVYIVYQLVLITVISRVLGAVNIWLIENLLVGTWLNYSALISKVLVTPITMIMNFIVMKFLIERI